MGYLLRRQDESAGRRRGYRARLSGGEILPPARSRQPNRLLLTGSPAAADGPRTHADGGPLLRRSGVAENKVRCFWKSNRLGRSVAWHNHLDGDPCRPVGALHAAAALRALKARIDLGSAITFPRQCTRHRFEIDATDHRPRPTCDKAPAGESNASFATNTRRNRG